MPPIIAQPTAPAHPDEAARNRHARLAHATPDQTAAALAYISMIDPLMFEIAMDAAAPPPEPETPEDEHPVPLCRHCGAQLGIFLTHGLDWQHFHGDGTAGAQQIYDPGHPPKVTWHHPSEPPEQP